MLVDDHLLGTCVPSLSLTIATVSIAPADVTGRLASVQTPGTWYTPRCHADAAGGGGA